MANSKMLSLAGGLTEVIHDEMCAFHSEYTYPSRSGDQMDEFLQQSRRRIADLRAIRDQLENVSVGLPKEFIHA